MLILAISLRQIFLFTIDKIKTQNNTSRRRDTNKDKDENNDLSKYVKAKKST